MILRGRLDDRVDVIAVRLGRRDRLDQNGAAAFAAHVAVGALVEGLALAVAAQHPGHAKRNVRGGTQHDLHAADNRHVTASRVDRFESSVKGD